MGPGGFLVVQLPDGLARAWVQAVLLVLARATHWESLAQERVSGPLPKGQPKRIEARRLFWKPFDETSAKPWKGFGSNKSIDTACLHLLRRHAQFCLNASHCLLPSGVKRLPDGSTDMLWKKLSIPRPHPFDTDLGNPKKPMAKPAK